jgi:hypothetical protein
MSESSRQKLIAASQSVNTAVLILRREMPTMLAFVDECRLMESAGAVLDPTLYRDSERQASEALVLPLFRQAIALVQSYDSHLARAQAALAKVQA